MSFRFEFHIKYSGIPHILGAHIFINKYILYLFFSTWSKRGMLKSSIMMLFVLITLFIVHLFCFIHFLYEFIYLFIFIFWLCWVFVSVRGLSLVAASGGHSSSRCAGLSLSWPLLLRSTVSRPAGSVVVAHGLSRSVACGIFPDQGSNPCPLHCKADS